MIRIMKDIDNSTKIENRTSVHLDNSPLLGSRLIKSRNSQLLGRDRRESRPGPPTQERIIDQNLGEVPIKENTPIIRRGRWRMGTMYTSSAVTCIHKVAMEIIT